MMSPKDRARGVALGLDRDIARRDVLHGIALGAAVALAAPLFGSRAYGSEGARIGAQDAPGYYPPRRTGMRGSHPGSFEAAHALAAGNEPGPATDSGEAYDLIVVGGGISGLAAAHFYRSQSAPGRRVLVLDNHDDFGGHAKRNEFQLGDELALMNGGTLEIDSPRAYSPVAAGLLKRLGIDVKALAKRIEDRDFYEDRGLKRAVFFDAATFGKDELAVGVGSLPWKTFLTNTPLSARARREIEQLESGWVDYLPGLSSADKKQRLAKISYAAFLTDIVRADPAVIAYYQARTHGECAVGIDAVYALDCWPLELPGFAGMKLAHGSIPQMGYTSAGYADYHGSPRLHFPDGNATIARLLVRNLVPSAIAGTSVDDMVTAQADYAQLDRPESPVRLRLNSIVVRARHLGEPASAREVEVTYLREGAAFTARARGCVLACYNMMIPYLVPELPARQRQALHSLVKSPLVYTSVALRNWQAFHRLGIHLVYAPGSYFSYLRLNSHVNIGSYRSPDAPDQPILLHMVRTPCKPGLTEFDQNRAGRKELLAASFETFEFNIRDQLARTLKDGGFDAANDITAITVNRWPHGYAPEFNALFDEELPLAEQPHVIGRAPFGRIVIANSDSGRAAYTDSAIDQAQRAVTELLAVQRNEPAAKQGVTAS
jgi:spermidine dehydrogenase